MEFYEAASALAAVAAAVWAWRSARSADKSYRLAIQQEDARKPNVDLYLIEGERLPTPDNHRMYRFHVRATNRAEAPNAIVEILLEIEYARGATHGLRLAIPHRASADEASFALPRLLQPKESVSGWATFLLPDQLREGARAETYRVILVDAGGNRFDVRPIIIPESEP
ncbi:MAG: hypothetical protein M3P06_20760 [Acidobacteriota bacterium]|nr:hypothetical protein [Acidobacteriota bacterium]